MEKEQIVKALEICANENGVCSECAYSDDYTNCNTRIAKDALSLIREQDKRIEELETSCTELTRNLHACKADTVRNMRERLRNRYEFNCNADEDNAICYEDLCEWVERIEKELLEEK